MPVPSLSSQNISSIEPFAGLSVRYLKEMGCLPLRREGEVVYVAMANPEDGETIKVLEVALGGTVEPVPASPEEIFEAIETIYLPGSALSRLVGDLEEDEAEAEPEENAEIGHLRDMAQEAPIIQLVNLLVSRAIEMGASDIHLEPFEKDFRVRYRKDGILVELESPSRRSQAAVLSRLKIMARMDIAERRLPQDGRFRLNFHGREIDFRVSTLPTLFGESMVLRILDRERVILDLKGLGFPPKPLAQFDQLIHKPYGIVLVTGPTGSGKTTTLYAALHRINSVEKKIITIEDPVEYRLAGVTQIQVHPKIGLTFASGLRHMVRQDPDVILVGEIRDRETAEIAVHAALTGHLVFSTLHTNDAAGAITRLMEMGIEDYLLTSAVIGILAQRLVRVICPQCRTEVADSGSGETQPPGQSGGAPTKSFIGTGCEACSQIGYQGRTGIYELLMVDEYLRRLILAGTDTQSLRQAALEKGMRSLMDDGLDKVAGGVTTRQELLRVTQD